MSEESLQELIEIAKQARLHSIAPFSDFLVGAAVRTAAGKVYTGCNVESASYGLTVCGERVAIWKALSEGERDFTELAIVTDTESLTPPCGTCRQIIWEFAKHATIILGNLREQRERIHQSGMSSGATTHQNQPIHPRGGRLPRERPRGSQHHLRGSSDRRRTMSAWRSPSAPQLLPSPASTCPGRTPSCSTR